MPRRSAATLSALACALLAARTAFAVEPPATAAAPSTRPAKSAFDPARHMRVGEIRPGMKGYGLTVLSGTTIERFDVEVVSVLHNAFGPQQDVIMIRCRDERMEHYGPIAGCSGSPIYLYDESGKARLIGAYAYGFDLAKDPIVGVQPIEYMMTLAQPPAGVDDTGTRPVITYSLLESGAFPRLSTRPDDAPPTAQSAGPRLRPLAVPLAIRGMTERSGKPLAAMFRRAGFEPLFAAGASAASAGVSPKLEPGSVLAAAVMTGDLELTALGTCTEVLDGRAYGFGHPFNGEGATSIPMGAGVVNLVMPTLASSFKIGGITEMSGALDLDGTYGVAGQIGATATMVPIHVEVRDVDQGATRTFNFRAALHRTFTPMMIATAVQAAASAEHELPVEHTAVSRLTLKFKGDRVLRLDKTTTSLDGFDVPEELAFPIATLMNNPFANVPLESATATISIERGVRAARIESASSATSVYRPGETARILIRFRKFKGESFSRIVDVPLPRTLADGDYTVLIGDANANLDQLARLEPHRFTTRNIDELFATLQAVSAEQSGDRLFVRLTGIDDGVSIGRTALRKLPPSRRAILEAAARPDFDETGGSTLVVVPMDFVVGGRAEVTIKVKRKLP